MAAIVHFDTGAKGADYIAHVTFFARAKRVRKVTRAKNLLAPVSNRILCGSRIIIL